MLKLFKQKSKRIHKNKNPNAGIHNRIIKSIHREAVSIALKYSVFGVLWILLSDKILEYIFLDAEIYKDYQSIKGSIYILITTIMLYLLINKRLKITEDELHRTKKAYGELRKLHEEMLSLEAELFAFYDTLTGLPNRSMFENEINKRLSKWDNHFIIAYLDIDNFKNINDTMGHHVGDMFLKHLADCLKTEIKEPDFVARLGGDEFAILYSEATKEQVITHIETVVGHISKTWEIDNHLFYITISAGVVIYPEHGGNSTVLLKNADIAL